MCWATSAVVGIGSQARKGFQVKEWTTSCSGRYATRHRLYFLIDGRPLHPSGPPFRTLDLPDRLTLGELFGLVREAFPEASPSFLRMNRCLLSELTLQRFHYPVVRALPLGDINEEPVLLDDSLWPTADLVEGWVSWAVDCATVTWTGNNHHHTGHSPCYFRPRQQ